jgi:predicted transposase/invertase (TIGR01784 family)
MELSNSHDKFFKEVFSNKEEAVDLLKGSLPGELAGNIDFSSLKPVNTSYINEALKETFSDLVYDCLYKGKTEIKIAILIEHKSFVPEYPHLQLLQYMLNIWEANLKQRKRLIPVIPMIFYAGKKRWIKRDFKEYFKGTDKELELFLPVFHYLLTDLTKYSDDEIRKFYKAVKVQMALLAMKKVFENVKNIGNFALIFSGIDKVIRTEREEKLLESVLLYIFTNVDVDTENKIEKLVDEIQQQTTKGGKIAMTIATRLEQKGVQQGLQQGILEGKKEAVADLFTKGKFSFEMIAELLNLNIEFVRNTLKEKKLIN